MTYWLEYFAEALREQLREVKIKGEMVIKKDFLLEKAQNLNLNPRQQEILAYLVEEKRVTVEKIIQRLKFVRRTVQRDLSKMIELGFTKEVAKSKTDPTKYYELL